MINFTFHSPVKLIFGSGMMAILSRQKMPGKNALVVISNGKSVRVNGYLDQLISALTECECNYSIYDGIGENPTADMVMRGAAAAKENSCDFIAALGGGAVLDAAKAIAAMAANDGTLWDYIAGGKGGKKKLACPALPLIAIPTTAGTGSELNAWGVINNPATREKMAFGGDASLYPVFSLVDPKLTLTVPQKYTAFQGMDAFFHLSEAMISRNCNPLTEAVALDAIGKIADYLPICVKDGTNLEAREQLSYASTMGGVTINLTSLVALHALEHALSAYYPNLPHGAGLILIAKAFNKFFIEKGAAEAQYIKMARVMGKPDADKASDFLDCLDMLLDACRISDIKMSDYGIDPGEFENMAENAKSTQSAKFRANPALLTVNDCVDILKESYR